MHKSMRVSRPVKLPRRDSNPVIPQHTFPDTPSTIRRKSLPSSSPLAWRPDEIRMYQPLDTTRNEIRLLHILPKRLFSNRPDDIFCTLKTASLDDTVAYRTLSYTWGTEVSKDPIYVCINGKETPMTIQENLYQALVHLRDVYQDEPGPLVMWADAICINQQDEMEKSHQVQQMRRVYENAALVMVWLGVSAEGSDYALESMREVYRQACELETAQKGSWESVLLQVVTTSDAEATYDLYSTVAIFRRPWWSRIWVVQEIATATTVEFFCGRRSLSDFEMYTACRIFFSMLDNCSRKPAIDRTDYERRAALIPDFRIRISVTDELPCVRVGFEYTPPTLVTRFMQWYQNDSCNKSVMEATDPRDLVFSLLGICRDAEELGLLPDYSKSFQEVFLDTACAIISSGNMNFLSLAHSGEDSGLPSWVPDWRKPINYTLRDGFYEIPAQLPEDFRPPGPPLTDADMKPHSASRDFMATYHINRLSPETAILRTSTIQFARVSQTLGSMPKYDFPDEILLKFWDYVSCIISDNDKCRRRYENINEAIFRSLTVDRERVDSGVVWAMCRARSYLLSRPQKALEMWRALDPSQIPVPTSFFDELAKDEDLLRYAFSAHALTIDRQAFITEEGWIGMGPHGMDVGDSVVIVAGADIPFVLRRDVEGRWRLVGEAFVCGAMDGEVVMMDSPIVDIDLY